MNYAAASVLLCASVAMAAPTEFCVAPDGDDAGAGTTAQPFATLARAREAVRNAPAAERRSVVVSAGTYRLTEAFGLDAKDSGTPQAPVVWRAMAGAEVRLTGSTALAASLFGPVTDPRTLARLEPAGHAHIVQASLQGVLPIEKALLPDRLRGPVPLPALFFNDTPMTLARWPNESWATIARIIDPGTEIAAGEKPDRGGVFEYAGTRPDRWDTKSGVWLQGFWRYDWDEEIIRVKAVDRAKHQITLVAPALYGMKPGNPSPRRYRAINLLEELDAPGEFYIDHQARVLYFWPPAALDHARIELALGAWPLLLFDQAQNVVVRGFILENTLGDSVVVQGGTAVALEASQIRHARLRGVRVVGGASHRITACDIHDTGAGGIQLEGGDRKTLTPAGHEAVNNHIWRFAQHQLTYAGAIGLVGVGNRAAHNRIHDAPHMAVAIEGNDHVFEYNVVHDVCTATDDAGALYKGRNPSCRGNIIRYNFWHHIGSPMGHGTAAIYFDDGDGGDSVLGNVFYRCGEPGKGVFGSVFSHGGHDLLAQNNIFIECRRALGSAPWNAKRWKDALNAADWQTKLLKEVNITQPPYTTRYPELVGFMSPKPAQPRVNRAVRNVFVKCNQERTGNWQVSLAENWIADRDPGFVDAAKGDFRLRSDAEVFTKLPGFEPVPFEKIGLYIDDLRLTVVAEPWR
ncbi:MAG: right-handed parallel beta-helix repeat-containing protein [Phycisphaeraceae bacterium]